jgi:diacylglycerol kinase family enzyme
MSSRAGVFVDHEKDGAFATATARHDRAGPVVVVVNARAGLVRRSPEVVRALSRVVGARGRVEATGDLDDLEAVVVRARAEGASVLASCGGDGSHMRLLTAIARHYGDAPWPRLCVLSGGTMNTAARNLGTAARPDAMLASVLRGGRTKSLRLLRLEGSVGFVAGLGFVAALMQRYYATLTGPVGTALLAARVLASAVVGGSYAAGLFRPLPLTAAFDDGPAEPLTVTALLAAVVPVPTLGIRAAHRAGEDGRFHLVGSGLRPRPLLHEVHRLWLGLPVRALTVDRLAERVVLTASSAIPYTLDGDMFEGRRLDLRLTPPASFLVGP